MSEIDRVLFVELGLDMDKIWDSGTQYNRRKED
jgi:hypothetical protein